jgi:hypothetical protein
MDAESAFRVPRSAQPSSAFPLELISYPSTHRDILGEPSPGIKANHFINSLAKLDDQSRGVSEEGLKAIQCHTSFADAVAAKSGGVYEGTFSTILPGGVEVIRTYSSEAFAGNGAEVSVQWTAANGCACRSKGNINDYEPLEADVRNSKLSEWIPSIESHSYKSMLFNSELIN